MRSASDPLRLATRGSPLALWQARRIVSLLAAVGVASEPVVVDTEGDRRTDVPLAHLGGQGVFVKEVQAAVVRGDAEAAVHSAKDLPAADALVVPGLVLAAFPERGDPRDVLVGARLDTLPTGATVATGSARRRVQLANLRPDLTFADLRGNLATRLARVGEDGITAVVAARAALDRMDWRPPEGVEVETLEPGILLPQVAQGALAVECRTDDAATIASLAAIDDAGVRAVVEAERAFLAELGGGCTLPVGAHAVAEPASEGRSGAGGRLRLTGLLAGADGHVVLRHESVGSDGPALGRAVARYLLDDAGGADLGPWSPVP
ncbi:MAG TPA: hydroxymethylbilane synthase [Acidimicrobiales bacterium]|nr:hydroxymethylbilane synthase [Acidimicrobiales bacterium]